MNQDDFIATALCNPINQMVLDRLAQLALHDCWLVSGSLFQTVWNVKTGRDPEYGIKDYDIFYFDPDTSYEAEDRVIQKARIVFADVEAEVEVRNQARVHLWYEEKHSVSYPPLTKSTEGIDRFLMPCAQIGLRRNGDACGVYAPKGFDDIEAMVVRPNDCLNVHPDRYREKASRWKERWPELTVISV